MKIELLALLVVIVIVLGVAAAFFVQQTFVSTNQSRNSVLLSNACLKWVENGCIVDEGDFIVGGTTVKNGKSIPVSVAEACEINGVALCYDYCCGKAVKTS